MVHEELEVLLLDWKILHQKKCQTLAFRHHKLMQKKDDDEDIEATRDLNQTKWTYKRIL